MFAHIAWPGGTHSMPVDLFLRALMRDVVCNFFYGTVNFDEVFGTTNHYGLLRCTRASTTPATVRKGSAITSRRTMATSTRAVFSAILDDWTNEGFDPFAAPEETGTAFGAKRVGNNS